jgi:hypothetical protein
MTEMEDIQMEDVGRGSAPALSKPPRLIPIGPRAMYLGSRPALDSSSPKNSRPPSENLRRPSHSHRQQYHPYSRDRRADYYTPDYARRGSGDYYSPKYARRASDPYPDYYTGAGPVTHLTDLLARSSIAEKRDSVMEESMNGTGRGYGGRKRRFRGMCFPSNRFNVQGIDCADTLYTDDDRDDRPARRNRYEEPIASRLRREILVIAEQVGGSEDSYGV